jgi:phospholipid/cholesterol/gamma-HCH transport system ATP-binding protein
VSEQPLVEINNVNFGYDNRPILKGINMSIPRGKLVAIMGLSGCGKTTILRHNGGVLKPDKGYVKVDGQIIDQSNQKDLYRLRRKMGMLFQFGALFTDMSVFDNVAFQMREHTDLPEEIIKDLVMMKLHAVGLYGTQDLMPVELSGGMARRVALARTIALDPMLIMYDEPFTGLDPISLSVVSELIRRLNDALGATSIVVTHDVQNSLKIMDYIYFVSDGAIIAEGTPDEIFNSDEAFVRQFVHSEMDGPIPFHYRGADYAKDMGVPI